MGIRDSTRAQVGRTDGSWRTPVPLTRGPPSDGVAIQVPPAASRPVPELGPGLWRDTAPARTPRPALADDLDTDVVVVGAGVVGLTAAVLAAEAGLGVALLEAHTVAHGTTGGTTGKVSSQNETRLATLQRQFGDEGPQTYTRANERGIAVVDELVARHHIACDHEHAPAHLVALHPSRVQEINAEGRAASAAGLEVETSDRLDELDLAVAAVLTFPDQRQHQPVRYAHGLADALVAAGGAVHEHTRVGSVARAGSGERRWRVTTASNRVTADHVIVATRLPIGLDRRLLFGRTAPMSAAGVAARVDRPTPSGMYLLQDADRTWSLRGSRSDVAGEHLVAVGLSAETGDRAALDGRGQGLAAWVGEHFPVREVTHAWMAQDQMPVDGRPYVGAMTKGLWAVTGLGKWGLAMGTAAAEAIVEQVMGRDDRYGGFFSPDRIEVTAGWRSLLEAQLRIGALFLGDRLRAHPRSPRLEPGEGRVVRDGPTPVATCRTRDGQVHSVSATCTHLGCLVRWNRDAQTWDCGCHGSRFAPDGSVLEAPATDPLRRRD